MCLFVCVKGVMELFNKTHPSDVSVCEKGVMDLISNTHLSDVTVCVCV